MMESKELVADQIEEVTGGAGGEAGRTKKAYCGYCKKIRVFDVYSGGRAYCRTCGKAEA